MNPLIDDFFESEQIGNSKISRLLKRINSFGINYDKILKYSKTINVEDIITKALNNIGVYNLNYSDLYNKSTIASADRKYVEKREYLKKIASNSEIDMILDIICNEAIVYDEKNIACELFIPGLELYLDQKYPDIKDNVMKDIKNIFIDLYEKFGFSDGITLFSLFKKYLIEGFLAFEIVIDEKNGTICGIRQLDPARLVPIIQDFNNEYREEYLTTYVSPKYILKWIYTNDNGENIELEDSRIIYISYSSVYDQSPYGYSRISYVERLVRSFNLLRIVENSKVIWNLLNSTLRMKTTIPVGTRSIQRMKEIVNEVLSIYKEEINIDFDTGELKVTGFPANQYYKNYIIPSRGGEQPNIEIMSTEGYTLRELDIIEYFWSKLKQDSCIPNSRFQKGQQGNWALGPEIDREEIMFSRFINKIRSPFQDIIIKPIWVQLILKYPELSNDNIFKSKIGIKFNRDNFFEELKMISIMKQRIEFINTMKDIKYNDEEPVFSSKWLVKRFLNFSDEDLLENEIYLKEEKKSKASASESFGEFTEEESSTEEETGGEETGGEETGGEETGGEETGGEETGGEETGGGETGGGETGGEEST